MSFGFLKEVLLSIEVTVGILTGLLEVDSEEVVKTLSLSDSIIGKRNS